jgi:hypothetical protein
MKLPNGANAVVDIRKLGDYCLSPSHSRGKHKARVFASVLGLSAADAAALRDFLLQAAATQDAIPEEADVFGQRYVLDAVWPGSSAVIRSSWIILAGEGFPRLTSCYVL